MTDLLLDPNDSGEIPTRVPGETLTWLTAEERARALADPGDDPTRNLAEYARLTPAFRALPSGELTAEFPVYTPGEALGFDGPQPPPWPLPPIPDEALTAPAPEPEPEPDEDDDETVFRRGCGNHLVTVAYGRVVHRSRLDCRAARIAAVRTAVLATAIATTATILGIDLAAWVVLGWLR